MCFYYLTFLLFIKCEELDIMLLRFKNQQMQTIEVKEKNICIFFLILNWVWAICFPPPDISFFGCMHIFAFQMEPCCNMLFHSVIYHDQLSMPINIPLLHCVPISFLLKHTVHSRIAHVLAIQLDALLSPEDIQVTSYQVQYTEYYTHKAPRIGSPVISLLQMYPLYFNPDF